MSVRLDELVDATREAVRRRKRERPLSDLEREVETGARGPPVRGGAVAPRHVA